MDETIDKAELLDSEQHQCDTELSGIAGTLEALTSPSEELETVSLTDHQQGAVTAFTNLQKDQKEEVYAVADQAALENYLELTNGLLKRTAISFTDGVRVKFAHTSKTLVHYAKTADALKARLVELRPLLEKREFPIVNVFEYGAYSRFFQSNGTAIATFTQFQSVLDRQVAATNHVFKSIESYSTVIAEKLLVELTQLQNINQGKGEAILTLRDSIERYWLQTWKEANITPEHGQTPQSALQAYPHAKFTSLCPLFDNRYLVAYQPKVNGGGDYSKASSAIKNYGVSVAFDKTKVEKPEAFMNVPNGKELLYAVDQCIRQLNDFKVLLTLAANNTNYATRFKNTTNILLNQIDSVEDKKYYGFLGEYFKLLSAVTSATQEPYVAMAWMFIRTAMVVTTLVELSVLIEPSKYVIAKRFTTKQNEEFSNMATEGYNDSVAALKAIRSSLKIK